MNLANKKVRKAFKKLQVGESTFFPWAILQSGGLDDRPQGPAYVGYFGKVYYFEPQPAGLKVTRESDELDPMVRAMAGMPPAP